MIETATFRTFHRVPARLVSANPDSGVRPPPRPVAHAAPAPSSAARPDVYRQSVALEYHLLGVADPAQCTLTTQIGGGEPIRIESRRMPAPGGQASQPTPQPAAPDGHTGLLRGTHILTVRGEIPVEALVGGDAALGLRGPALRPIIAIARSRAAARPVCIDAHAFGPGCPGRPLCVGADQPIFVDAMPVAAAQLVNGRSIRISDREEAELFNIDLGESDVLLAEGVPLASLTQAVAGRS